MESTLISGINESKKIRVNITACFVIFVFLLNETVRSVLGEKIGWINAPFFAVALTFFIQSLSMGNVRPRVLFVISFFSAFSLLNAVLLHKPSAYFAMTITSVIMPLLLLTIKMEKEKALAELGTFTRIFNVIVIINLVVGILDYLTGSRIQLMMAQTMYKNNTLGELIIIEHNYGLYRYYSVLGHPLVNAFYFLIFYVTNNIMAKYDKQKFNSILLAGIMLVGLLLCGSKTALVIGLVLVMIFTKLKGKQRILFYLFIGICAFLFYKSSLYQDNLKIRFVEGLVTGDLTTGRNTLVKLLLDSGGELPKFLLGGGSGYSREIAKGLGGAIYNFEYPSIMLAYDYGILGMAMIYACILIFPIIVFLKNKSWYPLCLFIAISAMLNTNNGIANLGSDNLSQLCILMFILINISEGYRKKATLKYP